MSRSVTHALLRALSARRIILIMRFSLFLSTKFVWSFLIERTLFLERLDCIPDVLADLNVLVDFQLQLFEDRCVNHAG